MQISPLIKGWLPGICPGLVWKIQFQMEKWKSFIPNLWGKLWGVYHRDKLWNHASPQGLLWRKDLERIGQILTKIPLKYHRRPRNYWEGSAICPLPFPSLFSGLGLIWKCKIMEGWGTGRRKNYVMTYYWDSLSFLFCTHMFSVVIRHLLQWQLLLRWYLRQQRVRLRVIIRFLVRGKVRIKIKIRIRVRVRVTFNVRVYHWSNCRRSKCHTFVLGTGLMEHVLSTHTSLYCFDVTEQL